MNSGKQTERTPRRDITGIAVETGKPIRLVALVVDQLIAALGYDAVVATTDPDLENHELTEAAAARVRETMLDESCRRLAVPGGDVRVYEPAPDSDDASRMYVVNVLGFSITIRRRTNEDHVVESIVDISYDPGGVLAVHVRGVENTYE